MLVSQEILRAKAMKPFCSWVESPVSCLTYQQVAPKLHTSQVALQLQKRKAADLSHCFSSIGSN